MVRDPTVWENRERSEYKPHATAKKVLRAVLGPEKAAEAKKKSASTCLDGRSRRPYNQLCAFWRHSGDNRRHASPTRPRCNRESGDPQNRRKSVAPNAIATSEQCEPEWRNWQTRQVEGLVAFTGSAGSSPVSGTL